MADNKANAAAAVAGRLANEKAMNKAKKAQSGYKSNLEQAKKDAKDAFLTKDAMDAKKVLREAASSGGKFGNLSPKKEATLGRAKREAIRNKLKAQKPKSNNAPYGNPNE